MAFQLSPGVVVTERDFSAIIPAVSTSAGAFAGDFQWGPVMYPTQITSENTLVETFGCPTDQNFTSFFTAANFLSYANNLLVTRVVDTAAKNAVSSGTAITINNIDAYNATYSNGSASVGEFAAKYPGKLGNSLLVSMADSASYASWAYKAEFNSAPGTSDYVNNKGGSNDELHIIVIDEDGLFTGTAGTILEKFAYASKASDAKKSDGSNNYYKNVVNNQSRYIYWMDHPTAGTNWGTAAFGTSTTYADLTTAVVNSLTGGVDSGVPTDGDLQDGFALYANAETYDISLLPLGNVSAAVANYVISNVAETRLDCVVFISPNNAGDPIVGSTGVQIADIVGYKDDVAISSSYAVIDSGVKYQYDRYNDVYRWVPLNGDVAGLCARTDFQADPWFSPGGMTRGQVKNAIKLGVNPNRAQRDELYKNGVNPVVSFPGEGTVLYGDKTMLAKPSAFDRINVRRLFIVLEKAIATAAKFQLFEFNDSFTRAQFKNIVEPFLRDVQGRRGVTDFRVVCDETNNTAEVIDGNNFVADIYIKPNRSINFITLNFVAARSGVNFEEIGA